MTDVRPDVVWDLDSRLREGLANFEGLALDDAGRLVLMSDNDYRGETGPTEVLWIR